MHAGVRIPARPGRHLAAAVALAVALAAGPAPAAERLEIAGLGDRARGGIFDPSFAAVPGSLWMSYSAVQPSPRFGAAFNAIGTRIAASVDGGATWTDAGAVNESTDVRLPPPHDRLAAKWEHETPRLAFDPWAAPATRWKLLWHRYLRVYDGSSPASAPLFEHGWIELKTAPDPRGPWSAGRKLFAGAGYHAANDSTIGPPEIRLDRLAPGAAGLGDCLAFSEPGLLPAPGGIYVSLKCGAMPPAGKVVLLRCDHEFRACTFTGTLLRDRDAPAAGSGWTGFSATDLAADGNRIYLVVTPTRPPGETYDGCLFFELDSLEPARIRTQHGQPVLALHVTGVPGSFHGACGFVPELAGGVYLSQHALGAVDEFRIYKTGTRPR